MNESDEMIEARHQGRIEAEAFDLRLRVIEAQEREDRLTRLVAERSDLSAVGTPIGQGDTGTIERLQRDVELLAAFQRSVVRSKGWRLIQMVRRVLGRAW